MDRSNLIVNYLPSGYTENDLEELFEPFGPLLSVKIVRDKVSGISMGFGFVNFESNASASAAVAALNGMELREDKIMKVSVARPAWKANIHSNLYLAGFPPSFTEADLMEFLGVNGTNAENVRLLKDVNKNPRGAAVVRMSSEEVANAVVDSLNGIPFPGSKSTDKRYANFESIIQVRPWRPEFRPDRISDDNIATTYQKQSYQKYTKRNNPSRQRDQPLDATQLLRKLSQSKKVDRIPAPSVVTRKALPPTSANTPLAGDSSEGEPEEVFVLFIYHLPNTFDEESLREVFEEYGGSIESVRVMPGKGYGFVSYTNEKDAVYAMAKLNGARLDGGPRGIEIEIRNEII